MRWKSCRGLDRPPGPFVRGGGAEYTKSASSGPMYSRGKNKSRKVRGAGTRKSWLTSGCRIRFYSEVPSFPAPPPQIHFLLINTSKNQAKNYGPRRPFLGTHTPQPAGPWLMRICHSWQVGKWPKVFCSGFLPREQKTWTESTYQPRIRKLQLPAFLSGKVILLSAPTRSRRVV